MKSRDIFRNKLESYGASENYDHDIDYLVHMAMYTGSMSDIALSDFLFEYSMDVVIIPIYHTWHFFYIGDDTIVVSQLSELARSFEL